MLFNSITFAIFFILVFGLYSLMWKHYRRQNLLLLAASYVFYGWWDIRFLFLIVLSTAVDYVSTLMIDHGKLDTRQRCKVTGYVLGALLLFVIVQWDAVSVNIGKFSVAVDWETVFQLSRRNVWASAFIVGGLALFHALSPVFQRLETSFRRKFFVIFSITINLLILGFFKYFNFFSENFAIITERLFNYTPGFVTLNIVLPVGISFFTFQTMSHTIDVYRRKMPSTASLVELSTYVAFFPQLVAGPIERGAHLLPQFQRSRQLDPAKFRDGMWLIFWGLYKKIVIADNLSVLVNSVFGSYDRLEVGEMTAGGATMLLAVYAFAIQIYCDFSGYTDIARGTAQLMGFDIMLNFNIPYLSKSPSEFWQRWHISLSSWLKDYLYIPLGGNRGGNLKTWRNLMITMLLGGLWHGAAWTFVIWGAFHGAILVIYRVFKQYFPGGNKKIRVFSVIQVVIMFHLICIGWLLFRAQNLQTVGLFATGILTDFHWSVDATESLKTLAFYSWFLVLFQLIQYFSGTLNPLKKCHWFVRLNVWIFIIMSIISLSSSGGQEFIYFAF